MIGHEYLTFVPLSGRYKPFVIQVLSFRPRRFTSLCALELVLYLFFNFDVEYASGKSKFICIDYDNGGNDLANFTN